MYYGSTGSPTLILRVLQRLISDDPVCPTLCCHSLQNLRNNVDCTTICQSINIYSNFLKLAGFTVLFYSEKLIYFDNFSTKMLNLN